MKELKIAIVTMAYGKNYGNRLQNYALQELLLTINVLPETIRYPRNPKLSMHKRIAREGKYWIKTVFRKISPYEIRGHNFILFNERYIHFSKMMLQSNTAPSGLEDYYDFFIVGSDQVWNAEFNDIKTNINNFLLSFAPKEKRIAYAASFGTDYIAKGYEEYFKRELPKFKAISVREKVGISLVRKSGADAVAVLDPTMMLSADRWNRIAKKPTYIKDEPFILTYFLGGREQIMKEYIQSVAKGRKIVNLEAESVPKDKIEDIAVFSSSPEIFLWLIAHAECVLTDSFHACVFSILYHKPFMVFERYLNGKEAGMGSRIDTLINTFQLEQCRGDIQLPSGEPVVQNWNNTDRILAKEREKSLSFLKDALDVS